MNKAITMGLIGLLLFFGLQQSKPETHEIFDYLYFPGTITGVRDDGTSFAVLTQDRENKDNSAVFFISDDVVVLDGKTGSVIGRDTLSLGTHITAYYPTNTVVALSMPPQLTPEVVVVRSGQDTGFVHVAVFDDNLMSSDGQLQIDLSVETSVTDLKGKPVTGLAGKRLVVFYTTSTKSIPARTVPERIIVFD